MFGASIFGSGGFGTEDGTPRIRDARATPGYGTSDYYYESLDDGTPGEKFTAFLFDDAGVDDALSTGRGVVFLDLLVGDNGITIQRLCRQNVSERGRGSGYGWIGFDFRLDECAYISDGVAFAVGVFAEGTCVASVHPTPSASRAVLPRGLRK